MPLVDLASADADLRRRLTAAFERVLRSGHYVAGAEAARFEEALSARLGVPGAVGVASGTAAVALALRGAGVRPGDEVILPANTFFATLEAVLWCGAVPVLADVDPESAGIDPLAAEAAVTARTSALIAVHLYGIPADMDRLRAVAERHRLILVEDAAQAMGATWCGTPIGATADVAAHSFFPTKNLGALGEAGAVTTGDVTIAERVRALANHGQSTKNLHLEVGFNERIDELQAALLTVKLERLDLDLARRRRLAEAYAALIAGIAGVTTFSVPEPAEPAYHLFVIRVPARDAVLGALLRRGIGAAVHYPTPLHLQPACHFLGQPAGAFPAAEALASSVLSLPFFPTLSRQQLERTVSALAEAVSG